MPFYFILLVYSQWVEWLILHAKLTFGGAREKKEKKKKTKIQENFLRSSRLIILIIPPKFAVGEAKGRRAFSWREKIYPTHLTYNRSPPPVAVYARRQEAI